MSSLDSEANKGVLAAVRRFMNEPLPKGISWPQTFGSSLLAMIVVQIVTGILLSLYYSPNAEVAYDSVRYIETQVIFGKIIRGIHYFAASAMMILIFLHLARTFFYGAYKRPRQWTWVFGVVLLLLVLGFAFTGYLLPWDMKAYFATKVGLNISGMAPVAGEYVKRILQGGADMGTLTLARFFSLHVVVLPMALLAIVGLHVYYIRLHGPTPPAGRPVEYGNRFFPQQLFRDSVVAFLAIAIVVVLAVKFGAPLEARADPNDTTYVPRPDWYFYGLFQLLKLFEGKLEVVGAIVLPTVFVLTLLLLPFIDRSSERGWRERRSVVFAGGAVLALIIFLTALGAITGEKAREKMAAVTSSSADNVDETSFAPSPTVGEQLYVDLKCAGCHPEESNGQNLPPGMGFAGNKYQNDWLVSYLLAPHRVRWQSRDERPTARMPDFELSEQEAAHLAAFLMTKTQDKKFPAPEFNWAEADSEMVLSGQDLANQYGCVGCHRIGDEGQNIGPALTRVGSKLQDAYLFHIIQAPEQIIPGTTMKNFQLETFDIEDIVAYLRTLK